MNTTFKNLLAIGLATSMVFGCDEEKKQAQLAPQKIPVVKVLQKDIPIYDEMVGQVYGLKDIPIRARVDGVLEKIAFEEGTAVKEGQLLYVIDDATYLAEVASQESRVAEARTNMVNAKNELDRYKPLAEMNAVSKSDLDAAQASYDASKSSVRAAESNLEQARIRLGYCKIKAPIFGLIGKTEAREGEYVGREPNPVILNTVSRIDTVRVQFSISESKYLKFTRAFKKGKTEEELQKEVEEGRTKPNMELILSDGSVYEYKGGVDFVNSQVNSNTGSILIQASFPNPSRLLRPGLYAKVRVELTIAEDAILIPQRCLQEIQGQYFVMHVDQEGVVSSRTITPGPKVGDMIIVLEGLSAKDQIVIDALQKVRPEMKIEPVVTEFISKTNK